MNSNLSRWSAAWLLALAALWPASLAMSQAQPEAGGNKALMQDWVRRKEQARDQVYQDLKRQGLLPRDGSVSFEAVVKPDPKHPDKYRIHIKSLTIQENTKQPPPKRPSQANPQSEAIFGPRASGVTSQRIDTTPPMGHKIHDSITIIGGRPQAGGGSTLPGQD